MQAAPLDVLTRRPTWASDLAAALMEWQGRPFVWGQFDCLTLCRNMARVITGEDPLGPLPGYRTERGAARQLRRLGYTGLPDLVGTHLPEIAPASARRGDWVMIGSGGLVPGAFGVNYGRRSAHMGLDGLVMCEASRAVRAWRVA